MASIHHEFQGPSLDDAPGDPQLVVLDFSATWCGPCKRYDPVFQRMAEDVVREHPEAPVVFLTVDVDQNKAISRNMKVKSVPMTVVYAREKGLLWGHRWTEQARFSGVVPYPKLKQTVTELVSEG